LSIQTRCLSCESKLVVHDRFADRMVRCPKCKFEFKVPRRSDLVPSASTDLEPPEEIDQSEAYDEANSENAHESSKPHRGIHKEHGGEEEEDLEWDITPMVDVAFLLLIFFMLTASFSIQKAIPTSAQEEDKPSASAVQKEKTEQVESFVVQIDEYNAYTIVTNDLGTLEASSKQELMLTLQEVKASYGEVSPRVVIQAHMQSIHGAVVACMDAARAAGFDNFQMQSVEQFD